ncbi:MAG: D-2-hydroxyacid dehydrogenase family protein [Dehalococcoidia bacterium]
MTRIAIIDDYQKVALSLADWSSLPGVEVEVFSDAIKDPDKLIKRLERFDVVQTMRERTPMPAHVLEALPRLKLISATGRKQAQIDMEAANRLGILVSGTPGSGDTTAEIVWGLIISLARNIPWEDWQMRNGNWQTRLGVELGGRTLGVLGMGRLGTKVTKIAQLFDMNVIAWGPTLTPERAAENGATYVSWEDLFSSADVLTIHVPLTDLSRGWVTERELALMKPTAYLINTSRGPIVEEKALIEALKEGRIAGAGLDVYDEEPLPAAHPLLTLENVVLTPHLGYATRGSMLVFYRESVANIAAWLKGEPQNLINPEALPNARPLQSTH